MSALFLSRSDITALLKPADYLDAVETALLLAAQGKTVTPAPMHIEVADGAFHAKGAAVRGAHSLAAVKLNANFPGNSAHGLPTIQGVIVICDGERGNVLAIMDSIEITSRRTAAASAIAAKHLARGSSSVMAIIGCGAQALAHIEAMAGVLPIEHILLFDVNTERSHELASRLGIVAEIAADAHEAAFGADVVITCTTSRVAYLKPGDISPGAFVAAVGADNPHKNEISPALMAKAAIVVDSRAQCAVMGDLHHAIAAGVATEQSIRAELADVVAGLAPGRLSDDETVIFDSTGVAIQDVASAAIAYARALEFDVGVRVEF